MEITHYKNCNYDNNYKLQKSTFIIFNTHTYIVLHYIRIIQHTNFYILVNNTLDPNIH